MKAATRLPRNEIPRSFGGPIIALVDVLGGLGMMVHAGHLNSPISEREIKAIGSQV
jgi:hypothetical protein